MDIPSRALRPLFWVGTSLDVVRSLPSLVREAVGHELLRLQAGEMPSDWKPMSAVGPGVIEIRIAMRIACRILCIARLPEGVYVLHAFEKTSRRTGRLDIEVASIRFRRVMRERRR